MESFRYDQNGNLTNWVSGEQNWFYEWDAFDRLIKASSNGAVVLQNWYDANGRRIAKQESGSKWLYLYDGWDIVGVMNENGQILETFTRGVGLAGDIGTLVAVTHHVGSTTNGTFCVHANHRGDVVLTRSGTVTVGSCDYSAFGTLQSQTGTDVCRFKFSSKERDASTGFSYYGYRFYAPQWQRWVTRDPLGDDASLVYIAAVIEPRFERRSQGEAAAIIDLVGDPIAAFTKVNIDLYGALGNNPISSVDPLGFDFASCYADCIEKYRNPLTEQLPKLLFGKCFSPWITAGAAAANAAANKAVGPTGRSSFGGVKSHPTSWQHKLGSKLGTVGSRVGKFLGRAAIGVTLIDGLWDVGLLAGCYSACFDQ